MIGTHLSSVQLQALRQDLSDQLDRSTRQLDGMEAAAAESNGADAGYQELLVSRTAAGRAVAELTQAIERLDSGAYGTCGGCGEAIPFERLKIRPLAKLCIGCQRRHEAA
ncbi:MAG: TraR/DksA family transcriptional regulator [Nonomuraea sp.]|nr:TraR/DksA family transcriptional regulator [Nonomuraea sp.]